MEQRKVIRRKILKASAATIAAGPFITRLSHAQTTPGVRLEWQAFKNTPHYSSFVDGIRKMRANTTTSSRTSWSYWVNGHGSYCPHGVSYFLAWHRGYLHYFQETLRLVSGNSSLILPYWDYYKNATLPSEFTSPASSTNPLYVPGRVNTSVRSGLSLSAFGIRYKNFPRGMIDAFEPVLEPNPHGKVHNLIGGEMAKITSPMDPIFWLHHGQIDRLWAAWVAAGGGRQMPAPSDPYWSGSFSYGPNLTMERNRVIDTTTHLGYTYDNLTLPTSLPVAQHSPYRRVQFSPGQGVGRPPTRPFPQSGPRSTGANRRAVGGARNINLDDASITVELSVSPTDLQTLQAVVGRLQSSPASPAAPSTPYTSVSVVLDMPRTIGNGARGGFFYDVYMNLPETGPQSEESHLIGSFGPFEIDAIANHHGGVLRFPVTQLLASIPPSQLNAITISFVRGNGENFPRGPSIGIGELRVELTPDAIE